MGFLSPIHTCGQHVLRDRILGDQIQLLRHDTGCLVNKKYYSTPVDDVPNLHALPLVVACFLPP